MQGALVRGSGFKFRFEEVEDLGQDRLLIEAKLPFVRFLQESRIADIESHLTPHFRATKKTRKAPPYPPYGWPVVRLIRFPLSNQRCK
jgi:hypothetical protein